MIASTRVLRALLVLATAMLVGLSAAWAQSDGPGQAPAAAAGGIDVQPADPAAQPDGTGSVMRRPEPLLQKPSGFWTSGRPAVGGAYRYRLLGIGTGVMLVTAVVMVWVVRRYPRRNAEG